MLRFVPKAVWTSMCSYVYDLDSFQDKEALLQTSMPMARVSFTIGIHSCISVPVRISHDLNATPNAIRYTLYNY